MTGVFLMKTYLTRADVDEAAQPGESVAATLMPDGMPMYFLVSEHASDSEMRRLTFEVRNRRSMTDFEDSLLAIAEANL